MRAVSPADSRRRARSKKLHQQIGDALACRAAADARQVLIGARLRTRHDLDEAQSEHGDAL